MIVFGQKRVVDSKEVAFSCDQTGGSKNQTTTDADTSDDVGRALVFEAATCAHDVDATTTAGKSEVAR